MQLIRTILLSVSEPLSKGLIMKCSNCSSDAKFVVNDAGVSPAYYCVACLPKPLQARADAGQLDLPKPTQTKKAAAPKAQEPVAEESADETPKA